MPGKADPERGAARLRWQETFDAPPPPYLSVGFMDKALAYEAQCRVSGGVSAATHRVLRQIADETPVREAGGSRIRAGAHLVRNWNGRTYQVEVAEDGYRMDGRSWPSLSAIAKHITGTTWSGPRFFGLKRRTGAGPRGVVS